MTRGIIDGDGHICEPPAVWNDDIEKRDRADAIRVERDPDGRDWISIDGAMRRKAPLINKVLNESRPVDMMAEYEVGRAAAAAEARGGVAAVG